eukprot:5625769-Amphidinium_carterae.1
MVGRVEHNFVTHLVAHQSTANECPSGPSNSMTLQRKSQRQVTPVDSRRKRKVKKNLPSSRETFLLARHEVEACLARIVCVDYREKRRTIFHLARTSSILTYGTSIG